MGQIPPDHLERLLSRRAGVITGHPGTACYARTPPSAVRDWVMDVGESLWV